MAGIGVDSGTHNTTSPLRNHWRPSFPGRGCAIMEQFTAKYDIIVKFEGFQVSLENGVVRAMLAGRLILTYCAHLSHVSSSVCYVPLKYFDSMSR